MFYCMRPFVVGVAFPSAPSCKCVHTTLRPLRFELLEDDPSIDGLSKIPS